MQLEPAFFIIKIGDAGRGLSNWDIKVLTKSNCLVVAGLVSKGTRPSSSARNHPAESIWLPGAVQILVSLRLTVTVADQEFSPYHSSVRKRQSDDGYYSGRLALDCDRRELAWRN